MNLGYILKVKPAGFADGLDIGSERQIKDSCKNFECSQVIGNFETGTLAEESGLGWGQESRVQFHDISIAEDIQLQMIRRN